MTEPRTRSWMPPIPAPLQRLFDHFPLRTYPPNELPARSPRPSSLPTLYVFASDEDAARGLPSFNPSCLKWQTFLRLSNIPHTLTPSTNHASPTGALPFLLPPIQPLPALPPRPIPASSLEHHVLSTTNPPSSPTTTPPANQAPYLTLLTNPIRAAWLTALYLDDRNTPLLQSLYVSPSSTSPLIRASLLHQLRSAAESEVARILAPTTGGSGGWKLSVSGLFELGPGATPPAATIDREEVYARAAEAFESLAVLLGESATGWFFGAERPGVFDAGVFAYTWLVLDQGEGGDGRGLGWCDGGRLDGIVRRAGGGELVRHRERVWEMCWGGGEGREE